LALFERERTSGIWNSLIIDNFV